MDTLVENKERVLHKTFTFEYSNQRTVQNSDSALIAAITVGNEEVFEFIFRKYYTSLCAYGRSILYDTEQAEEIVQNVFVTLWEKHTQIEITQSLSSYLYRAVHNSCLNYLKHQKVRQSHQQYVQWQGEPTYEAVNQLVYASELEERINEAIEKLPPQCKQIFKMSRYDELKYQEIADLLNISVKTVENQVGKALKILRVALAEYLS